MGNNPIFDENKKCYTCDRTREEIIEAHGVCETGSNPMIQEALDNDKDTTGLCTLKELVSIMKDRDLLAVALRFSLPDGSTVITETKIISLEKE